MTEHSPQPLADSMARTTEGKIAYGILDDVYEDPGSEQTIRHGQTKLAALFEHTTDPVALRELQDVGLVLARLRLAVGVKSPAPTTP